MTITKNLLTREYKSGKSMTDIADILHCSVHKVKYWMDKYQLERRSHSDAAYLKENPHGDPFHIKSRLSLIQQHLFYLGLGLYWGEGTKAITYATRISNTDPAMIKTFRSFLKIICGIQNDKIHYSIVTFNDTDPEAVRIYWSKELGISADKFGTIVSIPPQGKGSYKKKSQFGVCAITVSNIKLKAWLIKELDKTKQAWIV